MICNVCSRETNTSRYETIGNQIVCCLSCVGLLVANDEDKCDNCQRPVWKDNYYIIDSRNYCSEKCKLTAVKRYLKRNNNLTSVNIKHIQNEYFKNESPIKDLQELRKEVKEFYKEFEFDENSEGKNAPPSSGKTSIDKIKTLNTIKEINESKNGYDINSNNNKNIEFKPEFNNEINDEANNEIPDEINNDLNDNINKDKKLKKCHLIPIKIPSIKLKNSDTNLNNFEPFTSPPSCVSRKEKIKSYRRLRNNYSFDNQDKCLYDNDNNNNNDIKNAPKIKYCVLRNNHSISNVNKNYKKHMKLKPTYLKLQNRDKEKKLKKLITIRIPNPHMVNINDRNNSRFENIKYNDSLENNENENYENVQLDRRNKYNNQYFKQFNTAIYNEPQKYQRNCHIFTCDNGLNDRMVYLCDSKYKYIDNSNSNF